MTQPPGPQTITKKELVNRIAEQTGQTKVVVKDILQRFLDEIIEELCRGNRLEFREFGVFEVKERAPRRAQNPRTLEKVEVPGKRVVKYKVGRLMRERVCEEREPEPPPPPKRSPATTSTGGSNSNPSTGSTPGSSPGGAAVPPPAPPKPPPSNSPF